MLRRRSERDVCAEMSLLVSCASVFEPDNDDNNEDDNEDDSEDDSEDDDDDDLGTTATCRPQGRADRHNLPGKRVPARSADCIVIIIVNMQSDVDRNVGIGNELQDRPPLRNGKLAVHFFPLLPFYFRVERRYILVSRCVDRVEWSLLSSLAVCRGSGGNHVLSNQMPRERCSLTPTGASPVSPTLLYSGYEEENHGNGEGTLRLGDVVEFPLIREDRPDVAGRGDLVDVHGDVNAKKQRVGVVGAVGGCSGNPYGRRKLSKTLLESLLLHEIRALDRLAHLKETELTEKACCFKTGTIRVHRCVPRREVEGWLVSDGLDAAKVLQSRLVLRNITLQLMEGSPQMEDGSRASDMSETGVSPRSRADALPVRVVPDLRLYLGSGSSAKHAGVLKAYGISCVVNVSAVVPNYHEGSGEISYMKVPVYDAEDVDIIGALKDHGVMAFIHAGLEAGRGVLVHCCAGRSRSVACVCAYLISRYGWSVEEALGVVRRVRVVSPNAGFLEQLSAFHREMSGCI